MRGKHKILILTISLVYASVPILAAETTIIQAHLFKGAWTEGHPGLKGVIVLNTSSHPAIGTLKAKLDSSSNELIAARRRPLSPRQLAWDVFL